MSRKSSVYFGPPLEALTSNLTDEDSVSGKLNRTAERYLEILKRHGLSEEERVMLRVCITGPWLDISTIRHLADLADAKKVLDLSGAPLLEKRRQALIAKLRNAPFADLVAEVERLGF